MSIFSHSEITHKLTNEITHFVSLINLSIAAHPLKVQKCVLNSLDDGQQEDKPLMFVNPDHETHPKSLTSSELNVD